MDTAALVTIISMPLFIVGVVLILFLLMTNLRRPKRIYDNAGNMLGVQAPSPMSMPILGNLHNLAGYEVPYQSFSALERRFGSIISLQLGQQPALIVNGIENIKEVLITKTAHFDSRPNFKRYHALFSGNKENCKYFFLRSHIFCAMLITQFCFSNLQH